MSKLSRVGVSDCIPATAWLRTSVALVGLLLAALAPQVRAQPAAPPDVSGGSATYCATYKLDGGTVTETGQTFTATDVDTSAVWVAGLGTLTLDGCVVETTGNTSSQESSSFYGLNAGVLVTSGMVYMTGGSVTTSGAGANGVFAVGGDSSAHITDLTIDADADGGHAVMATQGGYISCTNVDMTTAGANSGAIATDRGSGTIDVTGSTVLVTGPDSPGIYSTGDITVSDATITATGAEVAVIEGANSITLTDTDLSSSFADKWGVMIYQSMSGDASGTHGVFTMTGGSLAYTADGGPLFFVTNSTGEITLTGVDVSVESGTLISASGTDRWGTSGANGGTVEFTADGETLDGDLITDSISSISATLKNDTTLTGTIDSAALSLDASSTWIVTGTSYLSSLSDPDGISGTSITNIVGNGFDVYYDPSLEANSALGGETYSLIDGGQLIPQVGSGSSTDTATDGSDVSASDLTSVCGIGAWGAGLVGYVPMTILGMCGLKLRLRQRGSAR